MVCVALIMICSLQVPCLIVWKEPMKTQAEAITPSGVSRRVETDSEDSDARMASEEDSDVHEAEREKLMGETVCVCVLMSFILNYCSSSRTSVD